MLHHALLIVFIVLVTFSNAYSRFGSSNSLKLNSQTVEQPSLNDQMLRGGEIRFYGRFRDGNNDVLNRYFNRLNRRQTDDLHDWLTEEQKTELKKFDKTSGEFKAKIGEYYSALPEEKKTEWNSFYRKHCWDWAKKVASDEEFQALQDLLSTRNIEEAKMKVATFKDKVDEKERKNVELWEDDCYKLYTTRKIRHVSDMNQFSQWLTLEQIEELQELKYEENGKGKRIAKMIEFFYELPNRKQNALKNIYIRRCKQYFAPLVSQKEFEEIERLYADEESSIKFVQSIINHLENEKHSDDYLIDVCTSVYDVSSRRRREIDSAVKEFVQWMTPEQLKEIGELKSSGKSEEEIRAKVKAFFGNLPSEKQKTLKDEFKGKCRDFFSPLMTSDELEQIKALKGNKEAAGKLVQQVVDRLEGDKKTSAQKLMKICGEVYDESSRRRREIDSAVKEFVQWMTPEQLKEIGELKSSGKSEEEIRAKVKAFFGNLPSEKQKTLKDEFKGKCRDFFSPLMTSDELEQIKALKGNKEAAGKLVQQVVDRLEGDKKTSAQKLMKICGEVYDESSRRRREIDSAVKEFVQWMTPEQLKEIGELKSSGKSEEEIRTKVKAFFGNLPSEKQKTLKDEFKGKCRNFFSPLMTSDELEQIKALKGNKEAAGKLVQQVVDRLEGDKKTSAQKLMKICGEVYDESSRRRRDVTVKDFISWMTPEQLKELEDLKSAGSSEMAIRDKTISFFEKLPSEQQSKVREELKGKCRAFFSPLLNDDEKNKIKSLIANEDKSEAASVIKSAVQRQEGDAKKKAEKLFTVCGEVYKEDKKAKRDVRSKIAKHLAWLTDEQKDEIEKMANEGADKEEIKKKLFEFVEIHEKDPSQKEKTVKLCYKWMDDVASKEEIESLHKLHHVDHASCKKKVREFISRLSEERQKQVEASLPFCEKLWYGSHSDHHHNHHRMRRHLQVIEKYVNWLDESQLSHLKKLDAAGTDFEIIIDKLREYFAALPEERQNELKSNFKTRCVTWAKEVSKPMEWMEIKKFYESGDHEALKQKLIELEERLTENQKHTIEHVRGVCYKLWGIKVSRRRHVINEN
ncbi:unnamed protein product [Caenorhabditis bovis]|uniref:Polyprotein allergen nematode domain-containing protein n=1 Tax=Caenorhabditis bovis TaxID=2654633 RepID=A0A8S1EJB8_9PELO|nr:unnamed protein product [Caenorhabditis bovis]